MTAKEAYGKLYRGVLRELTKWADDELVGFTNSRRQTRTLKFRN
jgi:hypothetical protein